MRITALSSGRSFDADAAILDMDGVVTETASLHERAWKRLFDEHLEERTGEEARPFTSGDYREHVDGKPRYEGVADFLGSRGIELPRGDPDDDPDQETICGLGNRKDRYFHELLDREGVERYDDAVAFVRALRRGGIGVAVISSSRNCRRVLDAAGVADLFDVRVDGVEADELGLPGKPEPDVFLEAARRLGVEPEEAMVVEDARAGVEAGSRGGFGLVVGVDRVGQAEELRDHGADVVVDRLDALDVGVGGDSPGVAGAHALPAIRELPSALDAFARVEEALEARGPALFVDYDGTLTPIVDDPSAAVLPAETRSVLERLRELCLLAVVSGRDLDDVRHFVDVDGIWYAGSHGLHLREPGGEEHERARAFVPALGRAEERLGTVAREIAGVEIERKRFAVAVHFRRTRGEREAEVEAEVDRVVEGEPKLRKTGGKKIFELRPDLDWDKGTALRWILEVQGLDPGRTLPLYIGDDVTDEDAFRIVESPELEGMAIVVRGEADERPTRARLSLVDPREVRTFLARIAAVLERS